MFATTVLTAALAAATPAASEIEAPQPAPTAPAGVIGYPPEFFASFAPGNAFEMLARLPGFTFTGGAEVRGFEGAAGNVLIDGERPASKSDDLESILRRIPFSQVERIDLIRGGAPGIDMQGQSVIANVVRKPGGGLRGLAAVSNNVVYDGRNAQGVRLEGSGKLGVAAWEASVVAGEGIDDGAGEGPALHLDAAGRPLEAAFLDTDGGVRNVNATAAVETPLAGGKLRVNGRLFSETFEYDELARVRLPATYLAFGRDEVETDSTELGGRYSRNFGERTGLELVAIQQTEAIDIASDFQAPGESVAFARQSDLGETIGRAKLSYRRSERLSFEAGAEGAFNWLEARTRLAVNGASVAVPAANVRVEEKRGEVFGKAVWLAHRRLTLEAGLRYEGSNIASDGDVDLEKTLYFLKPRAALTWAPSEKTQVRLRVERVVGQLDFDDFVSSDSVNSSTLTAGNPDLDPEQEWVVEAALERRFWEGGALVFTARRSMLTDVIDRAPIRTLDGVFDAPANIGEGTRDELSVNLTAPLARLGLKGAQLQAESTWRRSEVTDPTTLRKREISGLRPLEWEARFTHDLPALNTTWGVNVFGAWRETYYRFDEVDVVKLKTWVELFAEVRPRADVNVRLSLMNAGERGLRRTRYVYEGGRDVTSAPETFDRDLQFGRMVYVRVRKSFGA